MRMTIKTQLLLVSTLVLFSACCKPITITKVEYVKCEYPKVVDLNYTNDTNYTKEVIDFEIIEVGIDE